MLEHEVSTLRDLANEAAAEAVRDGSARRCFGIHSYTRWEACSPTHQMRECVRCGKIQQERFANECAHNWVEFKNGIVVDGPTCIGTYHLFRCDSCEMVKRVNL